MITRALRDRAAGLHQRARPDRAESPERRVPPVWAARSDADRQRPPWGTPMGNLGHTRLNVWLLRLGVRVMRGRPRHQQTQGKAERFHRTLNAELLSRTELQRDGCTGRVRSVAWHIQPGASHEALGMHPPATRYTPSERAYPETLPEPEYGPDDLVRRVNHDGMIAFAARRWFVSEALIGERVELRTTAVDSRAGRVPGPVSDGPDRPAGPHEPRGAPSSIARGRRRTFNRPRVNYVSEHPSTMSPGYTGIAVTSGLIGFTPPRPAAPHDPGRFPARLRP